MDSYMSDASLDTLTPTVIQEVKSLIDSANSLRTAHEKSNRRRFARMIQHPEASLLTMRLTDNVIRVTSDVHAARALRSITRDATISGIGLIDFVGIHTAAITSRIAPRFVMRLVRWRVQKAADGIILPAEEEELNAHIRQRANAGARLNVNVLGEAILGDEEAQKRCAAITSMLRRSDVNYVSVKISAVVSQILAIDHEGSIRRVAHRLREIYREAQHHNTFVNLDMEEFRDLAITVDVFTQLLDEPEFETMNAGIVLQAYLPDSHQVLAHLIQWAHERYQRTGGMIKIRVVKGANLAMEKTEAELHGLTPAPYPNKEQVDASYLLMLDLLLRPENAGSIRVGVASHNLFHLVWALKVAQQRGVEQQIDVEMLEGMANAEALAIKSICGSILLYTPVTYQEDFPSAVAYLVRRLDENTSPENYLSASFTMTSSNAEFEAQKDRFTNAVIQRHHIGTASLRHHLDAKRLEQPTWNSPFQNSPDSDSTNPAFRAAVIEHLIKICGTRSLHVPLGLAEAPTSRPETEMGIDPNDNGRTWYTNEVANVEHINEAVRHSESGAREWQSLEPSQRIAILKTAGNLLAEKRTELIAVMARDAGKTVAEADPEVSEAIDFANYYATQSLELGTDSTPHGTVLVVPPWNFPLAIPMGGVCAALAAGNAVILKPAPETVLTASYLANIMWSAGVPRQTLQFLPCRDDESGQHLITHHGIASVILTGAFETAEMFTRWKPDLRLLAETSGKNAIVITASADVDSAVKDLVSSAFGHAGQKCSAASLAIVHESIYRDPSFITQLKDAVTSLVVGPGTNLSTSVGPLIRKPGKSLTRALTQLESGEEWLVKPEQRDTEGFSWSPGVKLNVQPYSWSHLNEWFGPVLGIMVAPDLATAISWQNAIPYGLTAGIASLDETECHTWINKVQAGNLYVNRGITGAVVNRQPFGGWKRSSVGPTSKAGGSQYLNQLREWDELIDLPRFLRDSANWFVEHGRIVRETSHLLSELNYTRYCSYPGGILVRTDERTSKEAMQVLEWLASRSQITIHFSNGTSIHDFLLAASSREIEKVRWLSSECAPVAELLELGISTDTRSIAQNVKVELPRWLREQSVSITNHRYGNIGAGPRIAL